MKKIVKTVLEFEFSNAPAANNFVEWLCNSGEQHYWDYMECREEEDDTPGISVVNFDYWGQKKKFGSSPIVCLCGRLT